MKSPIQSLDEKGFALLEGMLPQVRAAQFAKNLLEAPHRQEAMTGYHIVCEVLNYDAEFAELVMHPVTLEIVRYLIGAERKPPRMPLRGPQRIVCG